MFIVVMLLCGCKGKIPPFVLISLGSVDESLVFGVEVDEDFFSLFFIVEFQKFLISLSVRPGKRAAIWDHLHNKIFEKIKSINISQLQVIRCIINRRC